MQSYSGAIFSGKNIYLFVSLFTVTIYFTRNLTTKLKIASLQLKQWKYLKSGSSEIQFQQVFDIAKIFPRCVLERRRPGLIKSGFIFCISSFGMCVEMH